MDFWMLMFFFMYALFVITVYKAYLANIVNRLRHRDMFLHYHILDTGEYGDFIFNEGANEINGIKRIYSRDQVFHGTLFYESKNSEPIKVKREIKSYKYYCDTKNFDTVARNDILQTLLILHAKDIIIMLIAIAILISIAGMVVTYYFTTSSHADIINHIDILKNSTALNSTSGITINK